MENAFAPKTSTTHGNNSTTSYSTSKSKTSLLTTRIQSPITQSPNYQITSTGTSSAKPTVRAVPARVGLNTASSKIYGTPVDARYSNQFGFSADISAKLTFKIVPVPAPDGADELRLVPDMNLRAPAAAEEALERLGLVPVFRDGDGVPISDPGDAFRVTAQEPATDSVVRTGDEIALTLSEVA